MVFPVEDFAQFQFSTAQVPPAHRIPLWYKFFGHSVSRRRLAQTSDISCDVDMTVTHLARSEDAGIDAGASIQRLHISGGLRAQRSRDLLSDGNGDLVLHIQIAGRRTTAQHGREVVSRPGEGLLTSNGEVSSVHLPEPNRFISIGLPRRLITAKVPGIEDAVARPLPDGAGTLALLQRYLQVIADGAALLTPDLRRAAVDHIHDLCALAIGATRDATELAQLGGLRAARLAALKADIRSNLADEGLSASTLARRHGITARYVHKLFEGEGLTLSRFVLGQRLAEVHRRLSDPRFAALPISTIAYDAGFSDISTFNRAFRQRFGATPSDIRAASGVTARR